MANKDSAFQVVYLDVRLEVGNNSLVPVSWFITYVREGLTTYLHRGEITQLLSTMDIPICIAIDPFQVVYFLGSYEWLENPTTPKIVLSQEQWKKAPGGWGFIGNEILPSDIGIIS